MLAPAHEWFGRVPNWGVRRVSAGGSSLPHTAWHTPPEEPCTVRSGPALQTLPLDAEARNS